MKPAEPSLTLDAVQGFLKKNELEAIPQREELKETLDEDNHQNLIDEHAYPDHVTKEILDSNYDERRESEFSDDEYEQSHQEKNFMEA